VRRLVVVAALLFALLALFALNAGGARANTPRPWLWQCEQIGRADAQWTCYVRLLLQDIDRSGDPADELPRIDARARAAGTSLAGNCHALMHEVGRRYGAEHHITLARLMDYIPRSNDPTCSAGFGMGLVMYLGPQIIRSGGRSALVQCMKLPTRYRSYTCVHGIGHALMRAYHGDLRLAVQSCRRLGRQGADCAQGAFHDYWISLHGADGTTLREHGLSPRFLCNGHLWYVRPCWYRYFVEQPLAPIIDSPSAIEQACRGLRRLQRYGCVSGAALSIPESAFVQTRICSRLGDADARACLRGVAVQTVDTRARQESLFGLCGGMAAGVRSDCREWFGRTLAAITNGRFHCPDRACEIGARKIAAPFVTFS
jgi:hypothetical protein